MATKVLFIDRDGTLALEPSDEQLDSFEKLILYPYAIKYLGKIAQKLDYKLVMVTNQDGLDTEAFPSETFWPVQNFIIETFKNEGVELSEIVIDKTFAKDNQPTRKPGTGLLTHYFSEEYDLANSFRWTMTDIELAKNLGAKGIFINNQTYLGEKKLQILMMF